MVSEIQDTPTTCSSDLWIPEFGQLNLEYLDQQKKYQGRIYRLSSNNVRLISEALGFTASFDSVNLRQGCIDLFKNEASATLDLERNTLPTDLNLRYQRDRWSTSDQPNRHRETLRPWIKTSYLARFLPERTWQAVADELKLKASDLAHFLIRINLKDKIAGLIAEEKHLEEFPAGAFQVFALPEGQTPVIPTVELGELSKVESEPTGSKPLIINHLSTSTATPDAKYATYSKSEVDRLLKTNLDSVANALSGKISSSQKLFQEALTQQEKAFAKVVAELNTLLQDTRLRMESETKSNKQSLHDELEAFTSRINSEMEKFRAYTSKSILPTAKAMEQKIKEIEVAAHANQPKSENGYKVWLLTTVAILTAVTLAGTVYVAKTINTVHNEVSHLHNIGP